MGLLPIAILVQLLFVICPVNIAQARQLTWKVLCPMGKGDGALKKKTFSSIATNSIAGVIFIWLVFCVTSLHCRHAHLVECGFCDYNLWLFPRRSAPFKWMGKKIHSSSLKIFSDYSINYLFQTLSSLLLISL